MENTSSPMIEVPRSLIESNPFYRLAMQDRTVFEQTFKELQRQRWGLEMIASENMPSEAVLATMQSVANNKYSEGYPGNRYYGGCEVVDRTESLAIDRAKRLFGAKHANVQPHSGTTANQAVWYALMKPGDTILSMDLDHGGHLSHGAPANAVGNTYKIVHYQVNGSGFLDYDSIKDKAREVKPRVIIAGASAYPRTIDFSIFREIADEVGAYFVADIAHIAGLVAAGHHPSSIDHAHVTTSTTHKTLRGPRGGLILLGKDYDAPITWKDGKTIPLHKAIDLAVFPGMQGGPLEHIIAAKAVAFGEAVAREGIGANEGFTQYQRQVIANAQVLAEVFMDRGYDVLSEGTDNHLLLLKNPRGLSGLCAQHATELVGITVNKNKIVGDKSPIYPSGLRLGTPAITTRGVDELDTREIGDVLDQAFLATTQGEKHVPQMKESVQKELSARVRDMCAWRPLYDGIHEQMDFVRKYLEDRRNG